MIPGPEERATDRPKATLEGLMVGEDQIAYFRGPRGGQSTASYG